MTLFPPAAGKGVRLTRTLAMAGSFLSRDRKRTQGSKSGRTCAIFSNLQNPL